MKIQSILVATDLTDGSDDVVRAGAALAALTDAKLHLLHSFDLELSPYNPRTPELPNFDNRVRAAERELDAQIRRAVRPGVEVASREVVIYAAHRTILECAKSRHADVIVLGPHRRRGRGAGFLGSTADRVVRTAEVPCLIVHRPLTLPLRRVLVPSDLSTPARGALDVAVGWAGAFPPRGDEQKVPELLLLHVTPRIFNVEGFPFDQAVIAPELRREAEAAIDRVNPGSAIHVREDVRWGDSPADEIVRVAEEEGADLLVLATHGRGMVQRAIIGSVASGVLRRAACPVLIVPPAVWRS